MGKLKIVKKEEATDSVGNKPAVSAPVSSKAKTSKKKVSFGRLCIQSTYNNTLISVTDQDGNALFSSSSGALGFKGARKGTPFASAKVAKILADRALDSGMKEVDVIVKGVGAGRESAIRAFAASGIGISTIRDITPIPHNGPKPPKPRRI